MSGRDSYQSLDGESQDGQYRKSTQVYQNRMDNNNYDAYPDNRLALLNDSSCGDTNTERTGDNQTEEGDNHQSTNSALQFCYDDATEALMKAKGMHNYPVEGGDDRSLKGRKRQQSLYNNNARPESEAIRLSQNLVIDQTPEGQKNFKAERQREMGVYDPKLVSGELVEQLQERQLLISLLLSIGASQVLYSVIATFLPPFRTEKHKNMTDTAVAVILAVFQVAIIASSPFIGEFQQKIGRKNVILIGYLSATIGCTLFGTLSHIDNDSLFFFFAILVRLMQGFGSACIQVAAFSIVGIKFPLEKMRYFGYCESATGLGMMGGPLIGQLFYSTLGFQGCFYATAGVLLIAGILAFRLIPNSVNKSIVLPDFYKRLSVTDLDTLGDPNTRASLVKKQRNRLDSAKEQISYMDILMNRRALMGIISCVMATIFLLFTEPLISDQLIKIHVSEHLIGIIFASACLGYAAAAPFVNYLTERMSKEYLTFIAFVLSGGAIFLQGPSALLGLQENKILTITGFILLGAMEAFIFVPLMPLITEAVIEQEKRVGGVLSQSASGLGVPLQGKDSSSNEESNEMRKDFEDALNDRAASVFQAAQAVGCIIGPLIGGILNDNLTFQSTCDTMAIVCLSYALIYFIINVLPAKRERQQSMVLKESIHEERQKIGYARRDSAQKMEVDEEGSQTTEQTDKSYHTLLSTKTMVRSLKEQTSKVINQNSLTFLSQSPFKAGNIVRNPEKKIL